MTIYYLKTGFIHHIPKDREREVIKFYKLFKDHGFWRNKRYTIVGWEDKNEN